MTISRCRIGLLGLLVLAMAVPAWGDEPSLLDGVTLNNHIAGQRATAESVRGKVVLFAFWDSDSASAAANLRTLRALMNDYDDTERFAIIVSHTGSDVNQAMEICRQTGFTLPVYHLEHLGGDDASRLGSSIFYGYVYNYDTELVCDGRVNELRNRIDDVMEDVPLRPTPMTAEVEIFLNKDVAHDLVPGNRIRRPLQTLERRAEGDDEQAAEAQAIVDSVNAWIESELAGAADQIATEPARAYIRLAMLSQTLRGMDEEDRVDELADPLKEDDNIEDLAEIILNMEQLQAMADERGPTRQVASNCNSAERVIERYLRRDDLTDVLRAEAEGVNAWLERIVADMRAQAGVSGA
jgi:hypothetical protein